MSDHLWGAQQAFAALIHEIEIRIVYATFILKHMTIRNNPVPITTVYAAS